MSAVATVEELFRRFAAKEAPSHIASLFSEEVDWYVAGDLEQVPWIGRKTGRAGVADFWAQIEDRLANRHFKITDILNRDDRVVVMGELESELRSTGRVISTDFVFDLDVVEGEITRFRMLEDSHAVAQAFIPV